ncbi:MAG: hypothetical protein AAGI68_12135 [Planctomycetota bacterium]
MSLAAAVDEMVAAALEAVGTPVLYTPAGGATPGTEVTVNANPGTEPLSMRKSGGNRSNAYRCLIEVAKSAIPVVTPGANGDTVVVPADWLGRGPAGGSDTTKARVTQIKGNRAQPGVWLLEIADAR